MDAGDELGAEVYNGAVVAFAGIGRGADAYVFFLPADGAGLCGGRENFAYLREQFSDYSYKEATLNPTKSARIRAVEWEGRCGQNGVSQRSKI